MNALIRSIPVIITNQELIFSDGSRRSAGEYINGLSHLSGSAFFMAVHPHFAREDGQPGTIDQFSQIIMGYDEVDAGLPISKTLSKAANLFAGHRPTSSRRIE